MTKNIYFLSDGLKLFGRVVLPEKYSVGVVFLHGGGHSNVSRYEFLQDEFEKNNVASLAFDFRGCGKSEGRHENGGLAKRLVDAKNAVEIFLKESKLNISNTFIWGSSMGGYTACLLTKEFNFRGIFLQSPAAYSPDSEDVLLNEDFTKLIIKENSWVNSKSFGALINFKNKKIVIYGEHDEIIPKGVQEKYKESLSNSDQFKIIRDGIHSFLQPKDEIEKKLRKELANIAINFIISNS